jgi:subtilisin-like proprotein convertase family protein
MKKQMQKLIVILVAILYLAISCKKESKDAIPKITFPLVFQDTISHDIPDASPSSVPGEVTASINIPLSATIKDPTKVTIELELQHTSCGDLVVEFYSSSGVSGGALIRRGNNGVYGDFLKGQFFRFTSGNTTPIDFSKNILTGGDYRPTEGTNPIPVLQLCNLNTYLNNTSIKGDWKIKVSDYDFVDTGKLLSWKITFNEGAF